MKSFWCLTIALLLMVFTNRSFGALVAYDGFNYDEVGEDAIGENGGFGFSGGWRAGGFNASLSTNFDIGQGSLGFPGLAPSIGQRLTTASVDSISGLTRDLAQPLGVAGTTRFLSFLLRPEGQLNQGAFSGFFGVLLESGEPQVFVGKPGGGQTRNLGIEYRGGSNQVASSTRATVDETYLMVLKSTFNAGSDEFSLYINPTPGLAEPLTPDASNSANVPSAQGITIYSTGAFSVDEFRLGETYADVVPVPEPAGWLFMLMAALTVARTRQGTRA